MPTAGESGHLDDHARIEQFIQDIENGGVVATGPAGPPGPAGPQGERGEVGPAGVGVPGERGPAGPEGPRGDVGPQGPPATVSVGSVAATAPGGAPSVTNVGDSGDVVLNFTIPRGETGPQGPQGDAASVTVGTVTLGTAGGTPSVTNSGDTTAAILDFVLIPGDTGATGATGPTGPQGLPGSLAEVGVQQFAADGSVLQNLPAQVPSAERLLKQAVWWIDAAHSSASGQSVRNLGWGGSALDAQAGSTGTADSNDPRYLDWDGENYVYLPGVASNQMTVPDEAALDITGDIDIRVKVAMDDWTPAAEQMFIAKGGLGSDAYALAINAGGQLRLYWGNGTGFNKFSTVGVSISDGATKWVRATLDVDNGASGNDVKFYTSDDGVTWTQLGTTVTTAGTTSIGAGTTVLRVGSYNGSTIMLAGKVYRAQVLNGIDGTPVLDIDCSQITSGSATTFAALTGQTVTINRSTSGRKAVAVTHPVWLFGTDDWMEVADNALIDFEPTQSFSIMAIIRQWATSQNFGTYVAKHTAGGTNPGYYLRSNSTNIAGQFVLDDGPNGAARATDTGSSGELRIYTSVVDRDAQVMRLLRGTHQEQADISIASVGDTRLAVPLRIGETSNGLLNQDFEFVAAAIFRRALTSDEISTLTAYFQGRAI